METNLSPETLIEQVLSNNAGRPCLTCSFQAEDMVVLHLLRQRIPDIPVLFLETGYHFAETYAYRDRMAAEWQLNLINLAPRQTVAEQENEFGLLYLTDSTECCRRRKVEPLMAALEHFDIWFTGLRREQSPTRRNLQQIEESRLPSGRALIKVSPLAVWTWSDIQAYLHAHEIEPLPLYQQGYLSIGCEPCTSLPSDEQNPRSGRWAGKKLECGIHTFGSGEQRHGGA